MLSFSMLKNTFFVFFAKMKVKDLVLNVCLKDPNKQNREDIGISIIPDCPTTTF